MITTMEFIKELKIGVEIHILSSINHGKLICTIMLIIQGIIGKLTQGTKGRMLMMLWTCGMVGFANLMKKFSHWMILLIINRSCLIIAYRGGCIPVKSLIFIFCLMMYLLIKLLLIKKSQKLPSRMILLS